MKRVILALLAAFGLASGGFAEEVVETTNILDLSKVQLRAQWETKFLKTTDRIPLVVDGKEIDGAYYAEPGNSKGADNWVFRTPTILFTKDVTVIGEMPADYFGLAAGANDITITFDGVTINKPDRVAALDTTVFDEAWGTVVQESTCANPAPFTVGSYTGVTLKLVNENVITTKSGRRSGSVIGIPAIEIPSGGDLTIDGEGSLYAQVLEPGINYSPALGIGYNRTAMGSLTIAGGIIVAYGGDYSAAIGKAYGCGGAADGSITITGGHVTATSGSYSAGIGGSYAAMVKDITITGGTVVAHGGSWAAGIGHGYATTVPSQANLIQMTITIGGTANVTAVGGYQAPAIGGGYNTPGGTIVIQDTATVTATAGSTAAFAIGALNDGTRVFGEDKREAGDVTVSETANVTVIGGTLPDGSMPGTLILDLATLEETSITVDKKYAMCLVRGTKEDFELTLPEGIILLIDANEADWNEETGEYDIKLKSVSCSGEFQMANFSPATPIKLIVGTVTGTMTMKAQDSSAKRYHLNVTESCDGKFNLSGACIASLPIGENILTFSPLASVTTADGLYPYTNFKSDWANGTFDLSKLTMDVCDTALDLLPEGFAATYSAENNTFVLTVPAMTTQSLTQSRKAYTTDLVLRLQGDVALNQISLYSSRMDPFVWDDSVTEMKLTLVGDSHNCIGSSGDYAAICVKESQTLTIVGAAEKPAEDAAYPSLFAYAGNGAAIGSSNGVKAGKILIPESYVQILVNSENGAGIGGGRAAIAESIEISGHEGTLIGGFSTSGAGIGTGHSSTTRASIKISGGKVAVCSVGGAGIGTGTNGKGCADIQISGGSVFARTNIAVTEEELAAFLQLPTMSNLDVQDFLQYFIVQATVPGAAIGGGQNTAFGSIEISGGTIDAGSSLASAIGGGDQYALYSGSEITETDTIEITGGTIVAHSTKAAAIGAGSVYSTAYADRVMGSVSITGGNVTATTGLDDAPAIGGTGYTGVKSIVVDVTTESGATINPTALASIGSGTAATIEPTITITQGEETISAVVAMIDGKYYATLQEAIDAATAGQTVTLLADVTIEIAADATSGYGLTIAADDQLTLDLAGYKLSYVTYKSSTTAGILNKGDLTITDSSEAGTGIITNDSKDPDTQTIPGYASNTITNGGKLTLQKGAIENVTVNGSAAYAIDTAWYDDNTTPAPTVVINDGKVIAVHDAIRLIGYSAVVTNSLQVNGGEIVGNRGVVVQLHGSDSSVAPKVDVDITGGTITATDTKYNQASVLCTTAGQSLDGIDIAISGGELNGLVEVGSGAGAVSLTMTGGHVNDTKYKGWPLLYYSSGDEVSVSGGTFNAAIPEAYCADGFIPTATTVDGVTTYGVKQGSYVAQNTTTNVKYETLEAALAEAKDGETVMLLKSTSGSGIIVPEGKYATGLTVDFNGNTYTVNEEPLAGSTGTQTQGFQLLKDNNITFKNGKIRATNPAVKMLVQNYSNLTLEGMTLDGTPSAYSTNNIQYVLSNNNGTTVLTGGTTITATDEQIAFDVCRYASYPRVAVTVADATVNGTIEVSGAVADAQSATLTLTKDANLSAATLKIANNSLGAVVTKDAAATLGAPAGFDWVAQDDGSQQLMKLDVSESFTVKPNIEVGGTVTKGELGNDGLIAITATANDGYTFVGWSGEGFTALDAKTNVTITVENQDAELIANFIPSTVYAEMTNSVAKATLAEANLIRYQDIADLSLQNPTIEVTTDADGTRIAEVGIHLMKANTLMAENGKPDWTDVLETEVEAVGYESAGGSLIKILLKPISDSNTRQFFRFISPEGVLK